MNKRLPVLSLSLGCGLGLMSTLLPAAELKEYVATIEVSPVKLDGKAWDAGGGAPDIRLQLDDTNYTTSVCQDRYRCQVSFVSRASDWYLEVYDQDLSTDDLVGNGHCQLGVTCQLNQATVAIRRKN